MDNNNKNNKKLNENTILELKNIVKKYPGVVALDKVSLEIKEGEVHALVGENGAGKSTLIKTITGAISPNEGEIILHGKTFKSMNPTLSRENGVSVIYQEFNLVPELPIFENIFLGRAIKNSLFINKNEMINKSREIFEKFGMHINPRDLVSSLTVGYQQIVEISKAISEKAKILIMDEPSAPLTNKEVEVMFNVVRKLKEDGVTIIYISHRLEEIFELSDRVTVLRDGKKITTLKTKETNKDELIKYMVGRELKETYPLRDHEISEEYLLEVKNLCGNGLENISFNLKKGEVLGISGLIGSGRTELAELLYGFKNVEEGEILLHGKRVNSNSPKEALKNGIALVPEDRKKKGALLSMSIRENISMPIINKISKAAIVDKNKEREIVKKYSDSMRIKTPSLNQRVRNLSGGNQQKVVIGKCLSSEPELMIFDEPTRGIDVGAKFEIYTLVNELAKEGKGLILISSEMEEIMGMADRIIVLAEGKLTGELKKEEFSQEELMKLASNIKGRD